MKKILFTVQWFPSVFSANSLCDHKIIDLLSENETYEITCLAYRPTGAFVKERAGKIRIVRFHKGYWWNKKVDAKKGKGKFSKAILSIDKVFLRLRQIITIPIYPADEPIANCKFAHEAIKLQKKEDFDLVIAEYHGFDSLHAGSILKKQFPNIKFIAILWDSFTGKVPAKYLPVHYANRKMEKAEMRELSCADKIIVMESSRKYHEKHSTSKPYYDRFVYLDIPGIVKPPEVSWRSSFIHRGKYNIVYAGILSLPDRDPEYIIHLLSRTSFAPSIHLIFFCTGDGKQKLEMLKKDFPGEITVSGFVDKDELVATYHEADILLNLGGPNPNMVPSKVFEYLSYGRPILSTYYVDDEASRNYLERYPLALCVDQRKDIYGAIEPLEEFIQEKVGKIIPFNEIQNEYSKNTPMRFVELINEVLVDDSAEEYENN